MLFQIGDPVYFTAAYTDSGVGKTGLTVTCTVWQVTASGSSLLVNAQPATEVGGGIYRYTLAADATTQQASLIAVFVTAGAVDQPHLYANAEVGYWSELIDVPISSRAVEGSVSVVSSVATGGALTLFAGADYAEELANEIQFTISTPTDYTGATVTLKVGGALSKVGVITSSSPSEITVEFKPTALETAALQVGRYMYQVQVALAGKETVTVRGVCVVEKKL